MLLLPPPPPLCCARAGNYSPIPPGTRRRQMVVGAYTRACKRRIYRPRNLSAGLLLVQRIVHIIVGDISPRPWPVQNGVTGKACKSCQRKPLLAWMRGRCWTATINTAVTCVVVMMSYRCDNFLFVVKLLSS